MKKGNHFTLKPKPKYSNHNHKIINFEDSKNTLKQFLDHKLREVNLYMPDCIIWIKI